MKQKSARCFSIRTRGLWLPLLGLSAVLSLPVVGLAQSDDAVAPVSQQTPSPSPTVDITDMSLASLAGLDVQVTSSAKKEESLRDATSALYVITSEDIRQSGSQHLADLFRMVPGLLV